MVYGAQSMFDCLPSTASPIDDKQKGLGGQRCRLQTALAIASNAEILMLDEPTAGLDRSTADRLIENLLRLSQTLIVITHDPSVADRFVHIHSFPRS